MQNIKGFVGKARGSLAGAVIGDCLGAYFEFIDKYHQVSPQKIISEIESHVNPAVKGL